MYLTPIRFTTERPVSLVKASSARMMRGSKLLPTFIWSENDDAEDVVPEAEKRGVVWSGEMNSEETLLQGELRLPFFAPSDDRLYVLLARLARIFVQTWVELKLSRQGQVPLGIALERLERELADRLRDRWILVSWAWHLVGTRLREV